MIRFSDLCGGFQWTSFRSLLDQVRSAIFAVCSLSVSARRLAMTVVLLFLVFTLLYQCGDVELNPGPPGKTKQSTIRTAAPSTSSTPTRRDSDDDSSFSAATSSKSMDEVISMFQAIRKDIAELKDNNATAFQQIAQLITENNELKEENKKLNSRLDYMEKKIDDLEARSKRNNLIFYGIPDKKTSRTPEDCEETLKTALKEKMDIANVSFDRVHRLRTNQTPQPIIARFTLYKERQEVLREKKKLQGTSIFVGEDFPASIREIRQKLKPALTEARKKNKRAVMIYDHLLIDGQRWDYDPVTQSAQPRGRQQRGH